MAEIDFSTAITNAVGEVIKNGEGDDAPPMTLAGLVATACFNPLKGDEAWDPARKAACGQLAIMVGAGGVHSVTAEQVAMLKDRIGRGYTPLVVARAWAILDPPKATDA